MEEESYNTDEWDMVISNLNPSPKKDKKYLSNIKFWRPISIGTSENWLLEKMFRQRLES